mmetsp:Transcript_4844/g.5899  ORF Transcript_4844/g.5899 Transcript_4844/m.5899 type:complete len:188 (+) Transcript_4844:246-809(+)
MTKALLSKVTTAEKQAAKDCHTILQQCKQLDSLELAHKKAKTQLKSLQTDLKKANRLFKSTLQIKIQYEDVISRLAKDPITSALILQLINATNFKQKEEKIEKKAARLEAATLETPGAAVLKSTPTPLQASTSPSRVKAADSKGIKKTQSRSKSVLTLLHLTSKRPAQIMTTIQAKLGGQSLTHTNE